MTCSPTTTTADDLRAAFEATSDAELLTMFARLTHLMDSAKRGRDYIYLSSLRAERDLVEAEALRRMGDR